MLIVNSIHYQHHHHRHHNVWWLPNNETIPLIWLSSCLGASTVQARALRMASIWLSMGVDFLKQDKARLFVTSAQGILARIWELSCCMFSSRFHASAHIIVCTRKTHSKSNRNRLRQDQGALGIFSPSSDGSSSSGRTSPSCTTVPSPWPSQAGKKLVTKISCNSIWEDLVKVGSLSSSQGTAHQKYY